MDKKYIVHTIIAWMMLVTLIILAYYAVIMAPWQIVVSSLVVILPIFTVGLYTAKLHKIHRLQLYHSQGIVFRILSGTAFSTIFWILIAIVDGALIFGQTSLRPIGLNIKTLSLYLLLFMLCKSMLNKIVGKTYKEYYKPLVIMFWASITSAFFSSLIWAYSDPLQIGMLPEFGSIAEAYTYILGQRPEPFAKCLGLFQDLIAFKGSFFLYIISKYSNVYINFIINFAVYILYWAWTLL